MANHSEAPHYPLIYVRGYVGSEAAMEDAAADPYMGFNVGSAAFRQDWRGEVDTHYFESPVVRLMKEYKYRDVYEAGKVLEEGVKLSKRSIVIFRYNEQGAMGPGGQRRQSMEAAAAGLGELIRVLCDRSRGVTPAEAPDFRVHLVAHSMGGLVCRCLLQNLGLRHPDGSELSAERGAVDKLFTYATPHGGIELNVLGNLPAFLTRNDADNFNRDRMREYLGLGEDERADSLGRRFDPERVFCLIGTNYADYTAGRGLVRKAVGPLSDGLVRIRNAATHGRDPSGASDRVVHSPRAFVHRAHSGALGIVNSEEGFQNLTRFLFGDVRVDGHLEIDDISLPKEVEAGRIAGKRVRASYHFEAVLGVRGKRRELHRRTAAESCAVFRTYEQLFPDSGAAARNPYLFSLFLDSNARVKKRRPSLGFSLDLGVLVPEYEVERKIWSDTFPGGHIFREKFNFVATPPGSGDKPWRLRYGRGRRTPNGATRGVDGVAHGKGVEFRIPISQPRRPGIEATLVLRARAWNAPDSDAGIPPST